jgi:hypothetical protein
MTSTVVRLIVDIIGLISLSAGIIGGIVTMFKEIQRKFEKEKSFGLEALPTAFIEALTKLLEALIKAPIWLALVIIGILLIFGSTLL